MSIIGRLIYQIFDKFVPCDEFGQYSCTNTAEATATFRMEEGESQGREREIMRMITAAFPQ